MDESSFDIDPAQVAAASHVIPAHRKETVLGHPHRDVSYLNAPEAEFGRHAWDEGGHL